MFLQQIFFQSEEADFSQFKPFMFTIENKENWQAREVSQVCSPAQVSQVCSPTQVIQVPSHAQVIQVPSPVQVPAPTEVHSSAHITSIKKHTFYASGVQDPIFWTIFIARYGYTEYKKTGKQFGNIEMKEKQSVADYIHKQGSTEISKQTNYKITRAFCCEIVSDLLTSAKMNYSSFIAYCAYYKTSIYVVDVVKKTYIPFLYGNSDIIVIYKLGERLFAEAGQSVLSLSEIREMFPFEHYEKPLKAISHYKTQQLEDIASKLNIGLVDKCKKNELYEKIVEYLVK